MTLSQHTWKSTQWIKRQFGFGAFALCFAAYDGLAAAPNAFGAGRVVSWGTGQVFPANGPTNIVSISSAVDHSLALKSDGTVFAWGDNMNGQCDVPEGLANVTKIAAGEFFSVALKNDGSIAAWGANDYGQRDVPSAATGVRDISAGHGHVLALKNNGTVAGWGCNVFGQATVPTGLNAVKSILAAGNYSVAVKSNGTVVAWGANDSGQTNVPAGLSTVKAVAGNTTWCMALKNDGTVVAWGQSPTLGVLNNVAAIAAGENHGLALTSNGVVIAWGANLSGAATVPDGLAVAAPQAITASWHHSAAVVTGEIPITSPRLAAPRLNGNNFSVSLPSQHGVAYILEYKNALTDSSWTQISTVAGTGSLLAITNTSTAAPRRFYRVRAE